MTEPNRTLTNPFTDQAAFMKAGNQTTGMYDLAQKLLYEDLIHEEMMEFKEACMDESLAAQIKEANDVLVVTFGWLHSVGIDTETVWKAVFNNNMLKVANPPVKDANGKIQKSSESIQGKKLLMEIIEKECA